MKILILKIPLVGNKLSSDFIPLHMEKIIIYNRKGGYGLWNPNELEATIVEVKE